MKKINIFVLVMAALIGCQKDSTMKETQPENIQEISGIELEDYSFMLKADNALPQDEIRLPYIRLYECGKVIAVSTIRFSRDSLIVSHCNVSIDSGKLLSEKMVSIPKDSSDDFLAFVESSGCEILPSFQNTSIMGGKLFVVKNVFKRFNVFSLKGVSTLEGEQGQIRFVRLFQQFVTKNIDG